MSKNKRAIDKGSKMEDIIAEKQINELSCLETEDPQKTVTVTTTDFACDADSDCDPVSTNNG
jgi:hypothetical protein